jgi:hypothetical protein
VNRNDINPILTQNRETLELLMLILLFLFFLCDRFTGLSLVTSYIIKSLEALDKYDSSPSIRRPAGQRSSRSLLFWKLSDLSLIRKIYALFVHWSYTMITINSCSNKQIVVTANQSISLLPQNKNKFIVYPFGDYALPGYNQRRSKRFTIGNAK